MNQLVQLAEASVIVFTDANVIVEPAALGRLRPYFADPAVGCVCGHLQYVNAAQSSTAWVGALYWRLEEWIKQQESDTGSTMGADGSLFAIRRECHRPVPVDLFDDMYLSLSILCDGYRVIRAPDVRAYENTALELRDEYQRKVRVGCQAFNVHRALWSRLRDLDALSIYKYVSHKLLRWLTIFSLGAAVAFALAGIAVVGGTLLAALLAGFMALTLWIGARLRVPMLAHAFDVLALFTATGVGVWRSLRGERFQIWTPAYSSRAPLSPDLGPPERAAARTKTLRG